jgi:uncharacterized protein YjdB
VTLTARSEAVSSTVQVVVSSVCSCSVQFGAIDRIDSVADAKGGFVYKVDRARYTLSSIPLGDRVTFSAAARASDGYVLGPAAVSLASSSWAVLKPVTVQSGRAELKAFEAVAPGKAAVAASFYGKHAQETATVVGPAAHLVLNPALPEVQAGQTLQTSAAAVDAGGTSVTLPGPVAWASDHPTIFTVDPTSGLITGVSPGDGVLRATSGTIAGAAPVRVLPAPVATVTVTPSSDSKPPGSTLLLTATPHDAAGNVLTGREVRWTTSSTAVAAVDQNGIVTAGTAGEATITATSEGKSGTATVYVPAPSTPPATTGATTGVAVRVYW